MKSYMGALRTAAAVTAVAAAAAGCSSGGSSSSSVATAAELLSASIQNTQAIKSIASSLSIEASGPATQGTGSMDISGTETEQLKPSLLAEFDGAQSGGPGAGAIAEIISPSAIYMKNASLASLTGGKPWLKIPLTGSTGSVLRSIINQAQSSNPMSATQLLAGSTNAKKVGTATIGGVPTTEVQGTVPVSEALAKLPDALKSQVKQGFQQLGITQIKYRAWIDGQNDFRKIAMTEIGKATTYTILFTITGINQPVHISVPSSSEVGRLPSGSASGSGL